MNLFNVGTVTFWWNYSDIPIFELERIKFVRVNVFEVGALKSTYTWNYKYKNLFQKSKIVVPTIRNLIIKIYLYC